MANSLIKAMPVIKYENYLGMTEIKNKREVLASIKQEDDIRDIFEK